MDEAQVREHTTAALRLLGRELERAKGEVVQLETNLDRAIRLAVKAGVLNMKDAVLAANGGNMKTPVEYTKTTRRLSMLEQHNAPVEDPDSTLDIVKESIRQLQDYRAEVERLRREA